MLNGMLDSKTISSRTPLTDCCSVSLSKGAHSISIAKLDARRPSADYKQLVCQGASHRDIKWHADMCHRPQADHCWSLSNPACWAAHAR